MRLKAGEVTMCDVLNRTHSIYRIYFTTVMGAEKEGDDLTNLKDSGQYFFHTVLVQGGDDNALPPRNRISSWWGNSN